MLFLCLSVRHIYIKVLRGIHVIILCTLSVLVSPVKRAACLGKEVALFSRPFEARPTDPLRREVFRQQAQAGHSSWFSPASVPLEAALELVPALQAPAGPLPVLKRRRRRRISKSLRN